MGNFGVFCKGVHEEAEKLLGVMLLESPENRMSGTDGIEESGGHDTLQVGALRISGEFLEKPAVAHRNSAAPRFI